MKTKVFGLILAATMVVVLVGCGGVSRSELKTELDKLDESKAPTFAPIWKEIMLKIFDKKYEEIEELMTDDDKTELVAVMNETKSIVKKMSGKMQKLLDSGKIEKENQGEIKKSISLAKNIIKMIDAAKGNKEELVRKYLEMMHDDVRSSYYEMMKSGQFKFVGEKIDGDSGYCVCQTDPMFQMKYHFKKVDGKWKMDVLKTSKASNEFLRDVLAVLSGSPPEHIKDKE